MTNELSRVNETDLPEGGFCELESILAQQFHGARRGSSNVEPLRRLMAAMMIEAIRSFQKNWQATTRAARQEFAEVRSWIFSDNEDGPFCFRAACDALQLHPDALRKLLVQWRKKKVVGQRRRIIEGRVLPAKRTAPRARRFRAAAVDLMAAAAVV